MLSRPRFKSHLRVAVIEPDTVFLLSETGHFLLRGPLYCRLAPLLDGRRSLEEITISLHGEVAAIAVTFAVRLLERRGYLCEADDSVSIAEAAFWHALDRSPPHVTQTLRGTRVAVAYEAAGQREPLERALAQLGIQPDDNGDVQLVVADDYLRPGLRSHNRVALASGRPWLLAKPVGTVPWVGPLFRPGRTGCWECLASRLRAQRAVETFLASRLGASAPYPLSLAATPLTVQVALALAVQELANWIAGIEPATLEGVVLSVDAQSLTVEKHTLVRRPQCPACGSPAESRQLLPRSLVLQNRPKVASSDGGHRSCTPEQTLARYGHHVSPITGIVPRVVRATSEKNPLRQVYLAGPRVGRPRDSVDGVCAEVRDMSLGKGVTESQARASALAEAIERYCGASQGDEMTRRASYRDLGEAAIHPYSCMFFSQTQYAQREASNTRDVEFHHVPHPFDEAATIDWTPLWSLSRREVRYLPTAYCYFGHMAEPDHSYCYADSNGSAAGNSLEEAIVQGLLELIERDSVALWWYNRVCRPAVDLASFHNSWIVDLEAEYRAAGRALWVLDLTSDLGVPAFAAVSSLVGPPAGQIALGFGAHFDPRIGVLRALTELNQVLTVSEDPSAGGRDCVAAVNSVAASWWRTATIENQVYLAPSSDSTPRRSTDFLDLSATDLLDDIRLGQGVVERAGLELLVLDQTRPDVQLPVVKVVVPGLRHFWPRFAPGRLYDVPVRLGWIADPRVEADLNPVPMFL